MSSFRLHIGPKTRVLNLFRRLFMNPVMERVLGGGTRQNAHGVLSRLVPPNYLYAPGSIRNVVRDGIRYRLDISHVVDHSIYFNLDDDEFHLASEAIAGAQVILDIGANIGNSSLRLATLNPRARIHAFEPDPDTLESARTNLALNGARSVTLHNCGLGAEPGRLKLYRVNEHNPGMNRIIPGADLDLPFTWIEIDTLDRFVAAHDHGRIGFVKIDVEGHELSVLKGGTDVLTTTKPVLHLELADEIQRDNGANANTLVAFLEQIGYGRIRHAISGARISSSDRLEGCHFNIVAEPIGPRTGPPYDPD